ncbi:aldo/keto reductase [Salinimonas iocasae]|uniref:Aldo/keto reductase n=1 Tax=Salinimonas iocasae TaxID=2572577 RepID=A0A5B7YK47_9ALTE|nr:aldo/keto reductase [Salinimonas iocasae]
MESRQLKKAELQLSSIGLGCWQLGGDFGEISDETAHKILMRAIEEGIRFFDTADVYGAGQSERLLGRYISQRDDVVIATKYGRGQGTYPDNYNFNNLRDSVLRSQDRLERDTIDLLQLHCVPFDVLKKRDIFDWLEELQAEGQIKSFGASVETIEEADFCIKHSNVVSLQIIFNLLRQEATRSLFDSALENDVGIIARLPLASGLLTGKFSADSTFEDGDHRNFNKDGDAFNVGETFSGLTLEKGVELVSKINDNYKPDALSMVQLALRWCLDHSAVTSVIAGASKPDQVSQNVHAAGLEPLPDALHKKLDAFYQDEVKPHVRGEI